LSGQVRDRPKKAGEARTQINFANRSDDVLLVFLLTALATNFQSWTICRQAAKRNSLA
jgi:hypothetical protein